MANLNVTQIEGFDELNKKLKKLDDSVKRKEILGLQRKLAKPIQRRYAAALPNDEGTLSGSVAIKTVSSRRSGGNPSIVVRPGKRGRFDAYYKFMVIRKGARPGSNVRGSRKGLNTVVKRARDRTLSTMQTVVTKEAEIKAAALVQKKINRLSK